jgi:single-stranded DNA-specific DHH superfamily exonuclease
MLTNKQIKEIREHLEKAQNPVFFFDNDPDGLCSFLILQRFIKRGKGVAIRSFPGMNADYFRKVTELNADYIFILDKPVVSPEFFNEARNFNIPVVWIDHHRTDSEVPDFVSYYNPAMKEGKDSEPTTYMAYQIADRKEDVWLGVAGCISDRFVPDFYSDFVKAYPDLAAKGKDAFEIFYKAGIGRLVRIFSFALKDSTTNVMKMIKFLESAKDPYEVLEECKENKTMHVRFRQIFRKYEKLLEKAKALAGKKKILFFRYSGDLSISADLANELIFLFPEKMVFVFYLSGIKVNISARGKHIRSLFLKALEDFEDATGGGHEDAVGGRIRAEDIEKFKKSIESELANNS